MNSSDPNVRNPIATGKQSRINFLALFPWQDRIVVDRLFRRVSCTSTSPEDAVQRALNTLALYWSAPGPGDNPQQASHLYSRITANLEAAHEHVRDLLRNGRGWTAR